MDPGLSDSQDQAHTSSSQNQGPAEQLELPAPLQQNSPTGVPGDHSTALCLDKAQSQLGSSVTIDIMPNLQSAMELSIITGDREGHSTMVP